MSIDLGAPRTNNKEEERIALFLLGYHVVLTVKALRCSRRSAAALPSARQRGRFVGLCAETYWRSE